MKKEDKGMYQCFIRNDQESAGASAELKLGGRCMLFIVFIYLKKINTFQLIIIIFIWFLIFNLYLQSYYILYY